MLGCGILVASEMPSAAINTLHMAMQIKIESTTHLLQNRSKSSTQLLPQFLNICVLGVQIQREHYPCVNSSVAVSSKNKYLMPSL